MNRKLHLLTALIASLLLSPALAQIPNDIETEREEFLSSLGASEFADPESIRRNAQELLSRPIPEQEKSELEVLAREANRFANLLSRIVGEYEDYERANSRYSFVIDQLNPYLSVYVNERNYFLDVRNRAYLNLGTLHEQEGDQMRAFSFYNDAFRLSIFPCSAPTSTEADCVRLAAERGMLRILGMDSIQSYVRWR